MDGVDPTHRAMLSNSDKSSGANDFVYYARKYFLFWSLFIFCIVFILVIRPSSVFYLDPATNRRTFVWSSFFTCVLSLYAFVLLIVWAHRLCRM